MSTVSGENLEDITKEVQDYIDKASKDIVKGGEETAKDIGKTGRDTLKVAGEAGENTVAAVSNTFEEVFTTTNMLILLGFLGIYFGYTYYNRYTSVGDSSVRTSSMVVDILFFIVFLIIIYLIFTSDTLNSRTISSRIVVSITDYINHPSSVLISALLLVGLYISIYLFSIPNERDTKPMSIAILQTVAWTLLIITIFIDFFKYVFGISFNDFFNQINSYFEEEDENKEVTQILPTITDKKEVYNVSNNLYTFQDAKAICKALDADLATYEQVEEAYNNGAEWCNYGWSSGQLALFPTQKSTWNKLQKLDDGVTDEDEKRGNNCGRPGVNGGYIANPYVKFGVNCYGKKPKASQSDLDYMQAKVDQPYPQTRAEKELEDKIKYWKENKNKFLQLNSYNTKNWKSSSSVAPAKKATTVDVTDDCD
tara:strand:+ start:1854 stop:3125 length:1272 start_codon:yes stop_codon:yes gene_type:complete